MNRKPKHLPAPGHAPSPPDASPAVLKRRLQRETTRRITAETALQKSRGHYRQLLAQSKLMQAQLRYLSHQVILVQENERKRISRELHDEISQILTGINVRLATLKMEAATNNCNLGKQIVIAQRLVGKSVATVHRFARELRPAMLDDLGLIPALLAYLKEFGNRTGIRVAFTSVPADKIEHLDNLKRTMLYRVAQEALTNVAKHAQASRVTLSLHLLQENLRMEIRDNGKAFNVQRNLTANRRRHLGIIGMRERTEMLGGTFDIESVAGKGTIVRVRIKLNNGIGKRSPKPPVNRTTRSPRTTAQKSQPATRDRNDP